MKLRLSAIVAACVLLTACAAPDTSSPAPTAQRQAAPAMRPTYSIKGLTGVGSTASVAMPFVATDKLTATLDDTDAKADLVEGAPPTAPTAPTSQIAFAVTSVKQLSSDGSATTSGEIDFQDLTRKIRFHGLVDDMSAFLTDASLLSLYADIGGTLEKATSSPASHGSGGCRKAFSLGKFEGGKFEDAPFFGSRCNRPRGGNHTKNCLIAHRDPNCHDPSHCKDRPDGSACNGGDGTQILDSNYRFALEVAQTSATEVRFTFCATKIGETTPFYQYSGISDSGKLSLTLQ